VDNLRIYQATNSQTFSGKAKNADKKGVYDSSCPSSRRGLRVCVSVALKPRVMGVAAWLVDFQGLLDARPVVLGQDGLGELFGRVSLRGNGDGP
jgi:hypothetical protein